MKRSTIALMAMTLCGCSQDDGRSMPPVILAKAGSSTYTVPASLIEVIEISHPGLQDIVPTGLRQSPREEVGCGSTTNMTAGTEPYLLRFQYKTQDGHWTQQIGVAVGSFEKPSSDPEPRPWAPASVPTPSSPSVMCDVMSTPKSTPVHWSGGTMLCESDRAKPRRECIIEISIDGARWMTEFMLKQDEDPSSYVDHMRRFATRLKR